MDLTSPIPWSIFLLAPNVDEPHGSILGILSQLARLTRLQHGLSQAASGDKDDFEDKLAYMEKITAFYMEKALVTASLVRNDLIREASCLAGSIYTRLQFRDARTSDTEMQGLRKRLLYIFTQLELQSFEPQKPRLRDRSCCGFYSVVEFCTGGMSNEYSLCAASKVFRCS